MNPIDDRTSHKPEGRPTRLRHLPLILFVGAFVVAVAASVISGNDEAEPATVGAVAPAFVVSLLEGGSFDLQAHLSDDGRPVVLNLWASWCPPCVDEIPEIARFAADNPDVYVIGVAIRDPFEDTRRFIDKVQPGYDIGIGDEDFISSYPGFGLPNTYVIDSEGVLTGFVAGTVTEDSLAGLLSRQWRTVELRSPTSTGGKDQESADQPDPGRKRTYLRPREIGFSCLV